MKRNYTVEKMNNYREFITFEDLNSKGEKIQMELTRCESKGKVGSLPYLWKKNGHVDHILKNWWVLNTYVTDSNGNCCGRYNPQHKTNEDGKFQVNFDWLFESTEKNREKLITEVERLAFA